MFRTSKENYNLGRSASRANIKCIKSKFIVKMGGGSLKDY